MARKTSAPIKRFEVAFDPDTRQYVVIDNARPDSAVRSFGWDKPAADTFADQANVDAFQRGRD